MDPHLGDSSSDSDISNSWSIVDQELCSEETTQRDNSVDKESISESDGDSLEVIEDEKRDSDEFRDADVETDGISIITESEINEELDQALAWIEPKEKKYLHHPNTYLNSRLNVLLAISLAAVFGLGLGHFLGLQEECPLLNESVTAQIEKLQQENELLRSQLAKLLHNERSFSMAMKTALDLTCNNDECPMQKHTSENLAENQRYITGSGQNLPSSDSLELEAESHLSKKTAKDPTLESAEETQVDYHRNVEPEWVRTYPWPKATEVDEEVVSSTSEDDVNNKESYLKLSNDIQRLHNQIESLKDASNDENAAHVQNVILTVSPKTNYKDEQVIDQLSNDRKDQSLEAVRMALLLLESHFTTDDRTSPDAKDTLLSARSLTSDLEQSLIQLQTAITNSEVDSNGFFGKVLKKMKDSMNRVMSTMEEVADDVDEQMHKVLYKLTRKLRKVKGKFQEKLCHLSEKYSNKSHAIFDWLHSKILVDCKQSKDINTENKLHREREGNAKNNDFPAPSLDDRNKKYVPEALKMIKSSHFDDNKHSELVSDSILLKHKQGNFNEPPLIPGAPVIISESVTESDPTMTGKVHTHDTHAIYKTEKLNLEAPCWQGQHGKTYCGKQLSGLGKEFGKKYKIDEKSSQKKIKSPKLNYRSEEKGAVKPEKEKKQSVRTKTVEHRGWVLPDVNNMQNNASYHWMAKLAEGRAEQRRLVRKSDWVFERAHARRIQRDIDKKKAQWYFQRAQAREHCRYHPQSKDCLNSKSYNFQWDGSNAENKHRKHYTEDKSHYFSKWSKKFGKWMKNSFSNWQKVKYHSQH